MRHSVAVETRTFTMEEVAPHNGKGGSYWIVIRGEVYDVSAFASRHPGGSAFLQSAAGRQGDALFESYHPGVSLDRARKVLERQGQHIGSLVPEEVEPYGDPSFFHAVQERVATVLRERGLTQHSGAHFVAIEAVIVVILAFVAWYFRAFHASYIAAVVSGVLMGRLGFLMHSGNHSAVGRRTRANRMVGGLMEFAGASSIIWQYAHNVAHHSKPNIYGIDHDCEIGNPALRFHPEIEHRPWHRIQHVVLAVGMSFGMMKWLISDVFSLRRGRATRTSFHLERRDFWKAMVYKAIYFVFQIVVPIAVLGWWHGIATTFVFLAIGGYYMEGVFIVNHLQKDLVPPRDRHWAEQQILGSANWGAGQRWSNFISGGLNHQVEHHLFPSMAVHLYPIVAPVVKSTCEEFGLPYRNYRGFFVALAGTIGFLHDLGRPQPAPAPATATVQPIRATTGPCDLFAPRESLGTPPT